MGWLKMLGKFFETFPREGTELKDVVPFSALTLLVG